MATYYDDIVSYLVDFIDDYDGIESTELDDLIYDFLMTKFNGFSDELVEVYDADTTSYNTILIDTTSPNITILEWKELNLERVFNQALIQNGQAAISNESSPNYPLIDFRGNVYDFDADSSIDYVISSGGTLNYYLQYEFQNTVPIDGVMLQGGNSGIQSYTTIGSWCLLGYYLGYSNNGSDWTYVYNLSGAPVVSGTTILSKMFTAGYTTTESVAKAAPFLYYKESPLEDKSIYTTSFTKGIEAKYWRFYPVDLLATLTTMGIESGFTGYTASLSHVRFHQIKEHGDLLVSQTVKTTNINPTVARGDTFEETQAGTGVGSWVDFFVVGGSGAFEPGKGSFSGASIMWTLYASNSTANVTTWKVEYQDPDGLWTELKTDSNPSGQVGMYTDVYSETERDPVLDVTLKFRISAHAVGLTNMTIKFSYIIIGVSDTNSV